MMLGESEPEPVREELHNYRAVKRGRCNTCLDSFHGAGYRASYDKATKCNTQCQLCGERFCEEHLKHICDKCFDNHNRCNTILYIEKIIFFDKDSVSAYSRNSC